MAFELLIQPKARKSLNKISEPYQSRIIATLDAILANPFFSKALSGDRKGEYSVRVWPYRIIYTIDKKILLIVIIDVDHRQGIYK